MGIDAAPVGVDDAEAAIEAVLIALLVCVGIDDGVTTVADEGSSDMAICESSRSKASK